MSNKNIFTDKLHVINIGTKNFGEGLREQGVKVATINWRPPVDGNLLRMMRRCDEVGLTAKIEDANKHVLESMLTSDPIWIGMRPAIEVLPGMKENYILHSGPPRAFSDLCRLHHKGVIGGVLYEGWAASEEEAIHLLESGKVELHSCNDFATVGAGAGIVTPSMPVNICRDTRTGQEGFCLPFEGRTGLGVWGVYNEEVKNNLKVITEVFSPAVNQVLAENGGISIKNIIARSFQMNDEIHTRQTAAGLILLSEMAPLLLKSNLDRETVSVCIEMLSGSERWFHPLGMASAMCTLRGIKGTEYSTIVTAIASGGVETGLKVAAMGEEWFTAPSPHLHGKFFTTKWGPDDASPYCGDSTITEVVGMGAFAGAAAPAVLRLRGGTCKDAIAQSEEMKAICIGTNYNYPIPLLEFTGPPIGIDIRKVIETGITPVCHGGIISKEGGQIGAGIARFPIQVYIKAMYAFLSKYGIK